MTSMFSSPTYDYCKGMYAHDTFSGCNPATLSTETRWTIAKLMMKATTTLPCLDMCSGPGIAAAEADAKGVPAKETKMAVTFTVGLSKVVFIAYGVWDNLRFVPSVRPRRSDARCLGMDCVCSRVLISFRYPRRCAREQIRTRVHLRVHPLVIVRARRLPLDACRRVAVRGRDELRMRVGVVLDQDALIMQPEDGDLVPEVIDECSDCYAVAGTAVGAESGWCAYTGRTLWKSCVGLQATVDMIQHAHTASCRIILLTRNERPVETE
jgi:hypothetical protein